jgi:uncharacterized membrane protein (DUF485 family)
LLLVVVSCNKKLEHFDFFNISILFLHYVVYLKFIYLFVANFTTLGTPLVPDAHVTLSIEEQTKGDKARKTTKTKV